jgi:hypothetical protein
MLDKKINYDTWHQQDIKILLHKIAQNTEWENCQTVKPQFGRCHSQ